MCFAQNISARTGRPFAFVAMLAGAVVVVSANPGQAGVILPWVEGSAVSVVDFMAVGCGSSNELELPVASEPARSDVEERPGRQALVAGLFDAAGGASAPVNSASGQTSVLLAAMFHVPVVVQSLACSSRHLRERSLQLPHPPMNELLDPPKACA